MSLVLPADVEPLAGGPWEPPGPAGTRAARCPGPATPEDVPEPEPVWLTGSPWPRFGWVHRPTGPAGGGVAVLCPPLLGEHAVTYHLYGSVARSLAAGGTLVVRFDYEGTGDSAGPSAGPGRVAAWLDDVDRVVDVARQLGTGPLLLAGIRSGALVAAEAAERRGDVDALVLWDPWLDGRQFVRRQRALRAMRFPLSRPTGDVEVPGFVVDAAMADELAALRLPSSLPVRRALVLTRPGQADLVVELAPAVPGRAGPGWADVRATEPGEQEAFFEVDPLLCRPPERTAEAVVEWVCTTLGQLAGGREAPAAGAPAAPSGWPDAGADRGQAGVDGAAPVARGAARVGPVGPVGPVGTDGTTVVEEPVWLGPHRLFGVETRPVAGGHDGPVVVFLSSGRDSHVGPSRLWVDLARRWAALGVRCVRIDLSGWGDSRPRPGRPGLVLRAPEAFDDVEEIVAAAAGRASDVILVGLCSGAYQALDSSFGLAPLGVLAINPVLRFSPPELGDGDGDEVSGRRRLCQPRPSWVGRLRTGLPRPVVEAGVALRWAVRRLGRSRTDGSWLDELAAAGVHVYCVCGEDEGRQLPVHGPTGSSATTGSVRIDVVPGLDHALVPATQRRDVSDRLTGELLRIVAAAGRPARRADGVRP